MALGIVPALIVGAIVLSGLISLGLFLPSITEAITPFATDWPDMWAGFLRITVGTAMLGAALALVAVSFTALTLFVGEPFYERIWRAVEADHGEGALDAKYGFWRSVGDTVALIARGAGVALLAVLIGLIPLVGGILSAVTAAVLSGWLVADELISRALTARGMIRAGRRRLMRRHRGRVLGFGVATQLCFLLPLGAVVAMPAAVAGSTLLARSLLEATADDLPARR